MSQPRKRLFGPLFYCTSAVAMLVVAYMGCVRGWTVFQNWRETRSLAETLKGDDPSAREAAAAALVRKGPEVVVPYLLEATRDPRAEVRALACRFLVHAWAGRGN